MGPISQESWPKFERRSINHHRPLCTFSSRPRKSCTRLKSRASKHRATAMNFRAMCHDFAVNYTARSSLADPSSPPRDRVPRIMRIKRRIFAYFERGAEVGRWRGRTSSRERERRLIEDNSRMRYNSSAQDVRLRRVIFAVLPAL